MFAHVMKWSFILAAVWIAASGQAGQLPIANYSFEIPAIDPNTNPFMAVPVAPLWIELNDPNDPYSYNTGIFRNTQPNSPNGDHIVNPDGKQLAFLASLAGNAFLQELADNTYQAGKNYRLSADVCVSLYRPVWPLIIALYYVDGGQRIDIAMTSISPAPLTSNSLNRFFVNLPTVQAGDPWQGKPIGIAIRAAGTGPTSGGFWDIDNVRLTEYPLLPELAGGAPVNLQDFAVLASQWLDCDNAAADLTGDGCVNGQDLLILTEYWLDNV